MKRFLLSMILCFLAIPVFAQQSTNNKESEYYYVSVPIEKIYPYRKGYVIEYRKGLSGWVTAYLPLEWFSSSAGKGEIVPLGSGTHWPYMTVYYKAGEFSHVRLYVRRENHETWGSIPLNVNIDDRFENITDLKLEF